MSNSNATRLPRRGGLGPGLTGPASEEPCCSLSATATTTEVAVRRGVDGLGLTLPGQFQATASGGASGPGALPCKQDSDPIGPGPPPTGRLGAPAPAAGGSPGGRWLAVGRHHGGSCLIAARIMRVFVFVSLIFRV